MKPRKKSFEKYKPWDFISEFYAMLLCVTYSVFIVDFQIKKMEKRWESIKLLFVTTYILSKYKLFN